MTDLPPAGAPARVRFDRKDGVFTAVCLLVIAAGAAVSMAGFSRAFPEASIDFKVTRAQAVELGAKALAARGFDLKGFRALAVFDHDDEAKVFLERTLGLERANPLFGSTVPIWRWSVRWVKPLEKLEYRVYVSPGGQLLAFRRLLPEKDAAPDPGDAAARVLAENVVREMRGLDTAALRFIEATVEKRPARVDRAFVWESNTVRFGDAALRYRVEVQGDRVGRSTAYLEVPEKWKNDYAALRSRNLTAGSVATFGLALTGAAILAVFVARVRRKDVKWKWALAFAGTGAVLQFASALNELPVDLFDYETTEAWSGFVARCVFGDLAGALGLAVILLLLVAAGEPLYREAYPGKPALGRILSRRGLESRRFFRGVILGWALTALFMAYQVVFYLAAEKVGAWAPADVPYSNLLGTSFPWLAVLLMGFMPATTEEFSSRMFSIPFASGFLPRWAAVVLPAMIWGFAHSAYPNQPFYIRGIEVSLAGVAIGVVMLKADILPLLVWHFTVDALYTALLLVRSTNPYFVVSGAAAAGVLALPLVASLVLYARNGGFRAEEDLTNAAVGTAPPPEKAADTGPLVFAPARPLVRPRAVLLVAVSLGLLALTRLVLPRANVWEDVSYALDRAGAKEKADAFLKAAGDDPSAYLSVPLPSAVLPALEQDEASENLVPYRWSDAAERWLLEKGGLPLLKKWATSVLPGPVWQVRYVKPQDRHGAWVVVDARRGRLVAFRRTFPEEESGARPDEAAAKAKAAELLRGVGLDPASLAVVSTKEEVRKARLDHHIVFESESEKAGEAPRRVVVDLAGDKAALLATGLKLPEEWVRKREKPTAATYASRIWKVMGFSILLGLLIVELVIASRAGTIPWKRVSLLALLFLVPAVVRSAASAPLVLRAIPAEFGLPQIIALGLIGSLLGLLLAFGLALLALALVAAARPDAFAAFRRGGSDGRRALLAAAIAGLLVAAARSFGGNLTAAWPLATGVAGLTPPQGVDTLLPLAVVLDSILRTALVLGGGAALAGLATRGMLKPLPARFGVALIALGAFADWDARTFSELFVPLLLSALVAAAFLAGLAILLQDDPRSYLFAAAFLTGLRGAWDLLASGVASWAVNGAIVLAAIALLIVLRGFDRPAAAPAT